MATKLPRSGSNTSNRFISHIRGRPSFGAALSCLR
jgi:hypothetical protein